MDGCEGGTREQPNLAATGTRGKADRDGRDGDTGKQPNLAVTGTRGGDQRSKQVSRVSSRADSRRAR